MKSLITRFLLFFPFLLFGQDYQTITRGSSYLEKSQLLYANLELDSAHYYAKKSHQLFDLLKIDSLTLKSAILTAKCEIQLSKVDSIDYIKIANQIATKLSDWNSQIEVNFLNGKKFFDNDEHARALPYFLNVDSIASKHKIINSTVIKSLISRAEISRVGFTAESSDYAHLLLEDALKLATKINSQDDIHNIYIYLADTTGLKGDYEDAKKYIDLALKYFLQKNGKEYEKKITRLYLISTAYFKVIKRLDKAEESFKSGIKYARNKNNDLELARLLYYYGHFQKDRLNSCNAALISHLEAKNIFDSLNQNESPDYERLIRDIAECNLELKNYELASKYFLEAYNLKTKLVKKANHDINRRIETKYQTEKKIQEIALLTSQNELIEQQKKNQRNLLLAGIVLTSLAGIFFFFLYQNRQKTNKKLKEIDKLKSNFFANISHEFRTPLTLISAPIEKKLNSKNLSDADQKDFEMIQRNSARLLNLVNQLLDLSKLESGSLKLHVKQGNLTKLLKSITSSFSHLAEQKQIKYTIQIEDIENAWFDRDIIEKTTINLLSNAFKYTPENGKVNFNAKKENDKLVMLVENNGALLTKDKVAKIFNRFYQGDDSSEGVGIGLSLVKELVSFSNGSIAVENKLNENIQFKVVLPVQKKDFKIEELSIENHDDDFSLAKTNQQQNVITDVDENELLNEDNPLLLIVEDNADVRSFIKNSFSEKYKVIEAENGKIGLEKALEFIPDIIISDIMMPEIDGMELCKHLKEDERTCHIPIILLTAKAGEEDQYKGLDTGADAYITKPFKLRLVETRVQNLIDSRRKLRERYSQEVILKPKDLVITNLDEQFLEKVQNVLDEKLIESSFTSEEFSKAVGMSRMQLHRKLKALTDLSASEFIRSQRLKLAVSLLEKSDVNISEIAYKVGFNDHAYFSKCFKETYGCSPSEYHNNKTQ